MVGRCSSLMRIRLVLFATYGYAFPLRSYERNSLRTWARCNRRWTESYFAHSMKNCLYFKLSQLHERKSRDNPVGLVSKPPLSTATRRFFFKDVFISCSKWRNKGTFVLENCTDSNASGNVEKSFLAIKSTVVLKTEVFSLQRKIFFFIELWTLELNDKMFKMTKKHHTASFKGLMQRKEFNLQDCDGFDREENFSAIPEVFKFLQFSTKKSIPAAWFFQNTFGEKKTQENRSFTLWSTTILFYSV